MSHPLHRRLLPAAVATALIALGGAAHAQTTASPVFEQRIDNRQDRQEQRIEHGVASGALTAPEARRVGREQARITRAEARAEADGTLTRKEAVGLERRQDQASRHIARAKHDRQTRP